MVEKKVSKVKEKISAETVEEIYAPREDSFLLEGVILKRDLRGKKCLDMGCGSGIQSKAMFAAGAAEVVAVDVSDAALKQTKKNAQFLGQLPRALKSDLFSEIKEKFDFIAFNPPYVPSDSLRWRDTDGGKNGRVVINRFLSQFSDCLNKGGVLLLLVSSLNDEKDVSKILKIKGFEVSFVAQKKLFFETLFVIGAVKK
ncbi:MAG: HemK2/MTQ2 family protein methyltransferase [archaeon]|jgi:release factor glutamine methyltransferase